MRNPKWHRDEIILALDLYFDKELGPMDAGNPKIIALSELLNRLPIFDYKPDQQTFRNPNGVTLKLSNFKALDPNYTGKGMESYSKLDKEVFEEFSSDVKRLHQIANEIKQTIGDPELSNEVFIVSRVQPRVVIIESVLAELICTCQSKKVVSVLILDLSLLV